MGVVGGAERVVGQRRRPTQPSALDGEGGRHDGWISQWKVYSPGSSGAVPGSEVSPGSTSARDRRLALVGGGGVGLLASFCSTISSPGATVMSVSEKSAATIVPSARRRRPAAGVAVVGVAGVPRRCVVVPPSPVASASSSSPQPATPTTSSGGEQGGEERADRPSVGACRWIRSAAAGGSRDARLAGRSASSATRSTTVSGAVRRAGAAAADAAAGGAWPRAASSTADHRLKTAAAARAPAIAWAEPDRAGDDAPERRAERPGCPSAPPPRCPWPRPGCHG